MNLNTQQSLFELPEMNWSIKRYYEKLNNYKKLIIAYPPELWPFNIERSKIVSEVKILSTYLINAGFQHLVNHN